MKIGIASDHGGLDLKNYIVNYFEKEGINYIDYGTNTTDSVDYPEYGKKLSEKVVEGEVERGIAICGTGIGISIACNKVKGIRAALCGDSYSARMSREHNNSNILALGGRVTGQDLALEIVKIWLETEFEGGRHQRRLEKISDIEK